MCILTHLTLMLTTDKFTLPSLNWEGRGLCLFYGDFDLL
ncbi:hypothetical protein AVP1_0151 [Aeromonas phage AVP1]|nr:hypothetical protein AVP1_0151 [Aeromonas phage AVP1]